MTTVLCTLYNSLYLDKGLVLYDSLCECAKDFKLYVLCMDEKCYEVLTGLNQEYHIPVRLSDFEAGDDELLAAKSNRPMGEYCWTCSSSFIRYVLKHYNEDCCTYIDADMYFYSDPQILVNEMIDIGKQVMIVPHRFPKRKEKCSEKVGLYCVEFNTFQNTSESLEVLEYWRNRCIESCENLGDGIHWGDQKYLEELKNNFSCVHVCQNLGSGVAPWNIMLYRLTNPSQMDKIYYKPANMEVPLVFYHFQSVYYVTRYIINTKVVTIADVDKSLVDFLYYPYLNKIEKKKRLLESEYGIITLIKNHPTSKKLSLGRKILKNLNSICFITKIKTCFKHDSPYIIKIKA